MMQLVLDLTPMSSKMDKVRARLFRATRENPVSLLDFDRAVYGTSVDRLIRFIRFSPPTGMRVQTKDIIRTGKGGGRYCVYWMEAEPMPGSSEGV